MPGRALLVGDPDHGVAGLLEADGWEVERVSGDAPGAHPADLLVCRASRAADGVAVLTGLLAAHPGARAILMAERMEDGDSDRLLALPNVPVIWTRPTSEVFGWAMAATA